MNRRVPALMFAAALALVTAACGSSAPSGAETSTPSSPPASAASPAVTGVPDGTGSAAPAPTGAISIPTAPTTVDTLACTAPATPTPPQTEGPYYRAGAPERADLVEAGMDGTVLVLTGFVVDTSCAPLANARVEIWQADAAGVYDNGGYRLRGYVLTDADGRYTVRTIVPGEYPGRTEHIHVKVTPSGGATLTSQLYFPGDASNGGDGIFSPDLVLDVAEAGDGLVGTFTFVVDAGG